MMIRNGNDVAVVMQSPRGLTASLRAQAVQSKIRNQKSKMSSCRSGLVLVAILIIVALAAMVSASLLFSMRAEMSAASASEKGNQAYATAMSGVRRAMMLLQTDPQNMENWYNNPDALQNQFVVNDGATKWYFTIYAENSADHKAVRYGLDDEAGKININTATPAMLLRLPNMTSELADCLIDYRDPDNEARSEGAEQSYYTSLANPYMIKNGPLGTMEELLLVKGFNASIVFGEDANRNGILDANEDDGDTTFPPDNSDGQLDTGLCGVATAISYERSVDSQGGALINLNGNPAGLSKAGLSAQTIQFVTLYRAEKNAFKHPSELLEMRYQLKQDHPAGGSGGSGGGTQPGGRGGKGGSGAGTQPGDNTGSDGSGASTQPGGNGGGSTVPEGSRAGDWIESGVTAEQLPAVMDKLMVRPPVGLVNVNTASAQVLALLPGFDAGLAQQIVDARASVDATLKATTAWLVTQNVVDADRFKLIAPALTARSLQFRIHCVGFGVPNGRFRVIEAVVDLAGETPRISYLRDVTRLGLPFAMNVEQTQP